MLEVVKQTIENLPDKPFSVFYQQYIGDLEDKIIDHDVERASSTFRSIEDVTDIIRGINKLTEELK